MIEINNEIKIKLGYLAQTHGGFITDKRNDKKILDIFKRNNKLIDF